MAAGEPEAGLYWQSRMGNNGDGIGGNCHRYDIVTRDSAGDMRRSRLVVDYGIKIHNDGDGYSCSFPSPDGLFALREGKTDPQDHPEALLLTHSHEDHIGALRHAIDMGYRLPPLYCTAFTAQMVEKSMLQSGILDPDHRPRITVVSPGETISLGGAEITFVPVDHLPGASALWIRTKEASLFHSGDYKFDASLPLGARADPAQLREIGRQGVDMVVSDSTAAGDPSRKTSEAQIEANLTRLLRDQEGRAVVAALLGTQLDRLVSLGRAARATDRSLVVTGSSLSENVKAAARAGLSLEQAIGAPILNAKDARQITADRALVVTTGAFAQSSAGLTRSAEAMPGALYIADDTTVIIPQRAIPPIAAQYERMVARLESLGALVITAERSAALGYGMIHQSGHAIEADTRLLYSLLRPRHVVTPMQGAPGQLDANARIARSLGFESLTLPKNGVIVKVTRTGAGIIGSEEMQRIGAEDTGEVKTLPRARHGEARPAHPPPIYRYDRLDASGTTLLNRNIAPSGPRQAHAAARGRDR